MMTLQYYQKVNSLTNDGLQMILSIREPCDCPLLPAAAARPLLLVIGRKHGN
jgi:hypothetical protein